MKSKILLIILLIIIVIIFIYLFGINNKEDTSINENIRKIESCL